MTKEEKKSLVLKLSKELKISVIKAGKILEENKWNYNKSIGIEEPLFAEPSKKPKSIKKNKTVQKVQKQAQIDSKPKSNKSAKVKNKSPQNEIKPRSGQSSNDPHWNWQAYVKNCEKFSKHPKQVPENIREIGEGFWTMQEIVSYTKYLKSKPNTGKR